MKYIKKLNKSISLGSAEVILVILPKIIKMDSWMSKL